MYLLVADDLTGGNDAGIQFAKHGIRAWIAISPIGEDGRLTLPPTGKPGGSGPDMLVINTNTRNRPGPEAATSILRMASALNLGETGLPKMVFKKIDSTLRGNPGFEADALMQGLGFRTAFLAPSYPEQNRSVLEGILYVNNVPVHETAFADDPLTPIRESSVAAILARQSGRPSALVPRSIVEGGAERIQAHVLSLMKTGVQLLVFDAQTACHLRTIAQAGLSLSERPMFIGSAGLAAALAEELKPCAAAEPDTMPDTTQGPEAAVEQVLFICGSAHHVTHAQTAALSYGGVPVLRMAEQCGKHEGSDMPPAPDTSLPTASRVIRALARGAAVLATPLDRVGCPKNPEQGMALSEALSVTAVDVLDRLPLAPEHMALVMTGGETAYAVLQKIGQGLTLDQEISPGIALCSVTGGAWNGLKVVTKAGGFGSPETLVEILHTLRRGKKAA